MPDIDIQDWLTQRVAVYLEQSPADIDPTVKLRSYGLESIYALTLCVDVEETFGLLVEPTLAWDHPTIEAIAGFLAERLSEDGAGTSGRRTTNDS